MDKVTIQYKEGGKPPHYASQQAAGADVYSANESPLEIQPGERLLVPTGLFLHIPEGYEIQVRPRSGLAYKHGVTVLNSPGTIDSDYRGEVKVLLVNLGAEPFLISPGMRIAQLVVSPVIHGHFIEVESVSETERGAGGFGSTGH